MKERISWDDVWVNFVKDVAMRSSDQKFKVGAVIVTDDNTQVLALGYNGDHKGGPNQRDSLETGKSGYIHAEVNALIKCDYNNPKNKKMYLTHSPCPVCAKCIVNAGIRHVLYINDYEPDMSGIKILSESGVAVTKLNDN
jgi:dCMP deaminase